MPSPPSEIAMQTATPTVLILGAAGRFGQAAARAFSRAGWQVLAQVRAASRAPAGSHELVLPITDPIALARAAAGASVVVHGVNPLYHRWDEEALPALHQGLAVARALDARFMLPGNVYGFGSTMPARLREDTPERPDTPKGKIRVAMEDAMRAAVEAGQRCTVIRAGDFFGCGTSSWLDQAVAKDIARGRLVYPGPRHLPHAWAYLPDLAAAFVAVAGRAHAPAFETLHFAGHTLTGDELLTAIDEAAARLGLRPARGFRVSSLPWALIGAVGLVHKPWRELARMSYLWRVPHALDGSRLAQVVPLPPATPLVQALTQSLIDLGHAPRALEAALS
jgi:nucleoside-diphosphate-sugar epimerase